MYKNQEGYCDPTAGEALRKIDEEYRAKDLLFVLRYIVRQSGFELVERIIIKDKKSGRQYK